MATKSARKSTPADPAAAADKTKLARTDKDFEPSQDEQTVVNAWLEKVRAAEDDPVRKKWTDKLEEHRGYVYGTKHKDGNGEELTRTNLVFATISAMMPHLYAKNPDISITPSAACPAAKLPVMKKFCATAQAVIGQMFVREAKLKKRAKSNIRSTMTTSYGVLKMVFQKDYMGDPLVVRRIQDTQENIARIERLAKDEKIETDIGTLAKERDELKANLVGILSKNEVKIYKGFAIDRVASENFLVLDDTIREFDEYVDAAALGHEIFMPESDFETQFKMKATGATKYDQPNQKATSQPVDGKTVQFVCVIEIWDKSAGVIRTVAKGMNRWVREPYAPKNTPQRWYGFYVLGFNLVEGRFRPLSDVELLSNLQDEYNTTRTNFADARMDAVPLRIFRKSGELTEEDIKNLSQRRRNRDWIGIEGNPTKPIDQDIMQLEGLQLDPQAYDVSLIRNDMDVVVGLSDAGRANLIKPKTATEAEIMNQALGLRVGERRDTNEDLLGEMAEAALEIALRDLTPMEVKQIAGAEAEWPQMSVAEIFSLVDVNVRAGSSGRPDQAKEREQWTQLMPVIEKTMQTVGTLREAGHFDMADAAIQLLRETLRRFEERIDVDSFIPPMEKDENGKPKAQAQAAQQVVQLTAQGAAMKEELGKCQEELAKAKAGEQARVAQIGADTALSEKEIASKERIEKAKAVERSKTEKDIAIIRAAADVMAADTRAGDERLSMDEVVKGLAATTAVLTEALNRIQPGTAASAGSPAA